MSQSGNQLSLYVPSSSPSGGAVRVAITNSCGTSGYSGITVFPMTCGGLAGGYDVFQVFPNPADSHLIIEIDENVDALSKGASIQHMKSNDKFSVRLYDQVRSVLSEECSEDGRIDLNIDNVPKGIYFLDIVTGETIVTKRIVIN